MAGRFKKAMMNVFDIRESTPDVEDTPTITSVEERYYNPLEAHVGSRIRISNPDYDEHMFKVIEIREVSEELQNETVKFVDYILRATIVGKDNVVLKLRYLPLADPDHDSELTHCVIVLQFDNEMPYDEEFEEIVMDKDGIFVETDNETDEELEYERFSGEKTEPHEVSVVVLKDENNDGTVDESEVSHEKLYYWDFARDYEIGDIEETEYLFVDKDAETGYFEIWKGKEILSNVVNVF